MILARAIAAVLLTLPVAALALAPGERALELARDALIADGHIDVPYRLKSAWVDVTERTEGGDFDYPRALAGGLDLPFMSIYTPAELETSGGSWQLANQLIDSVEALAARAPDRFALVRTPAEAMAAKDAGRIALAMGMENGSPIEGSLEKLDAFRARGISYLTLSHSLSNHISDSSFDPERPHQGLSEFGRKVVARMNDLGMMVDVSHISDQAFYQVLEISRVPVIASHSSARHFTPGFERNMSDEMIVALARNGGLVMVNFGSSFLTPAANEWFARFTQYARQALAALGRPPGAAEIMQFQEEYRAEHPFPFASLEETLLHFDHIIKLVGFDHLGIGSDYDGVGDSLPAGLKDVSTYPVLIEAFLRRGYAEADIRKILGDNLLRVWSTVTASATVH